MMTFSGLCAVVKLGQLDFFHPRYLRLILIPFKLLASSLVAQFEKRKRERDKKNKVFQAYSV